MYDNLLYSSHDTISKLKCYVDLPGNTVIKEVFGKITNDNSYYLTDFKIKLIEINYKKYLVANDFILLPSHSCNPNAYYQIVGERVFLKSINYIKASNPITIDYELSHYSDDVNIICNCGFSCRKLIRNYKFLDDKIKEKYKKLNMVPFYIKHPYLI